MDVQVYAIQIRRLPAVDVCGRHRKLEHDLRTDTLRGERSNRGREIRERREWRSLLATRGGGNCETQQADDGWQTAVLFCGAVPAC